MADPQPAPPAPLPFTRPTLGPDEIAAAVEVLESGWIASGPKVEQFETALRSLTGARHALAVSSGTAALHLALMALEIEPGDEVITTPLTFVATANAIRQVGAAPVLADIDPMTLNLDPSAVAAAVTSRTRAILPVHFAGRPCQMDALGSIARDHDLAIVEDAAHAIGARYGGRSVGSIGDITCFSFHPNKNLTTIEGGAATTDRAELADRMRRLRFHGLTQQAGAADVCEPGYKYNLSDVAAAIGLAQLPKLASFIHQRTELVSIYRADLDGHPAVALPMAAAPDTTHAWNMLTPLIRIEDVEGGRRAVRAGLQDRGIATGVHYPPLHTLSAYRTDAALLPNATDVGRRILTLPLHPSLRPDDVRYVAHNLRDVIGELAGARV